MRVIALAYHALLLWLSDQSVMAGKLSSSMRDEAHCLGVV